MKPRTLNYIFFGIVDRRQECLMLAREATEWLPISSQDFYRNVAGVARALGNWEVSKGDRVAILSENRPSGRLPILHPFCWVRWWFPSTQL